MAGVDKPRNIFLRALVRHKVPRRATGSATSIVTADLMEEVGIHFPEAHLDPGKMAALAAAGYTEIGFDNVMPLFSVWHESAAMGCQVEWGNDNQMPDCRKRRYRVGDEISIPKDLLHRHACQVPLQAIRMLKNEYSDEVAVVGKVFGPWTLGYHMFGVQEFLINTVLEPSYIKRQMSILKEVTVQFGRAQIEAGADALCLGDHATRDLCSPDAYRDFLLDIHGEMNQRLPCPLILHICGDTSDRIEYIKQTGMACFHFDSKVPALAARALAGDTLSLMGGTSSVEVIQKGSASTVQQDVKEKLDAGIDIIGPECAVPLNAPFHNMKTLAQEVKKRPGAH